MYETTHSPRCTTRDKLISSFNKTGSGEITNVLWSAHRITHANGDNRSYSTGSKVVLIERSNKSNRSRDSQSILLHELCHQFTSIKIDHYHDWSNPNGCKIELCYDCGRAPLRPKSCVMDNGLQNIANNPTIICNECKRDILKHLSTVTSHKY